jgi:hypothetical protein
VDKEGVMLVVHHGYAVPRFGSGTIKIEAASIPVEQVFFILLSYSKRKSKIT